MNSETNTAYKNPETETELKTEVNNIENIPEPAPREQVADLNNNSDPNKRVKSFTARICVVIFLALLAISQVYSIINRNSKNTDDINNASNNNNAADTPGYISDASGISDISNQSGQTTENISDISNALNTTGETQPAITDNPESTANTVGDGYFARVYTNGDKYEGEFKNGLRNGQGIYTWKNGIVYNGEFINGEPTGNGTYIYPETPTAETSAPSEIFKYDPEIPKPDFLNIMFETAIDIPESSDKIEPPPKDRTEELQYNAVPLNKNIPEPSEYFKNIILLGDSVTLGFDLYRSKIKFNGEAVLKDITVIASGSYGILRTYDPITDNSIHPRFNGKQAYPEDIISQKDAKYVLICLGLNDVSQLSTENYISYYSSLIDRIKEKSPDKTVVITSVTPLIFGNQKTKLNNKNIAERNNALLKFAGENNIKFIDYAAAVRDGENNLYDELSSDGYCHLTITAYERIIAYMLYHPLG